MSSDYAIAFSILFAALAVSVVGLLSLGAIRAFQMSNGLVDVTYRRRARWAAAANSVIAIVLCYSSVVSLIAPSLAAAPSSIEFAELGFAGFGGGFIAIFAFADSTVLVAIQSDFFHRGALGWTRARRPAWIALLACAGIDAALGGYTPFFAVFFVVAALVVSYAAAALIVGAIRTQDKTLKRHVKLLGWAIVVLLPSVIVGFISSDIATLISEAGFVAAAFVLYRALMSLTPLGHAEKNAGETKSF